MLYKYGRLCYTNTKFKRFISEEQVMERVIALILAATLILSLMGCANANSTAQNDTSDSQKTEENSETASDSQTPAESPVSDSDVQDSSAEPDSLAVSNAVYPQTVPYPDEAQYVNSDGSIDDTYWDAYEAWNDDYRARRDLLGDYSGELDSFFTESIRQVLDDSQGRNRICSPVNIYMALGMLAEVTDAESREQILTLLGSDNVGDLRTQANTIWNANYMNDGINTIILASSLWLNEDVNFVQPTLDTLAQNYYASTYQGVMGSDEMNHALQGWLDEQTGGLLNKEASNVFLEDNTVMALATTINFHAKWCNEFNPETTQNGVFHGTDGDINCDFMHEDQTSYYWGEKFSAVSKALENKSSMWFILPDEDVSVDELLQDGQMMEFILSDKYEWENNEYVTVHLSVPKFDVSSDMDLISDLKALGVTDVFDPKISDFTPMTLDVGEIYLSQAKHAVRVKIDEEGCTAASYTVMAAVAAGLPPEEEMDFILDRPFVFVITGNGEMPLFIGVVNRPVE